MTTAIEDKFNVLTHDFKLKEICVGWSEDHTGPRDWEPQIDEYEKCFENVSIELTGEELLDYFDDELISYYWDKHPEGLEFVDDDAYNESLYKYFTDNFDTICAYLEAIDAINKHYNNQERFTEFINNKWFEENMQN